MMEETVTTEDREVTITGEDGVPTKVVASITRTDHGVFDEDGYPKVSVNINVPAAVLGVTPGKNE